MNLDLLKIGCLCALTSLACRAAPATTPAVQAGAGGLAVAPAVGHGAGGSAPVTMTEPSAVPRAGSDAPTFDAGSPKPDAAVASDASVMAQHDAAAIFSDSFDDSATLDPARFEVVMPSCTGNGVVSIDSTGAHSGAHSVQVKASGGYCNHVFFRPKTLPAPLPDPLYVRAFVKLDQALGAGHVTFVALHDTHDDGDLRMGGQDQILMWNRESDDATLPELSPTGVAMSTALAAGNWHCIEWMVGSQPASLSTWVDGSAIAGLQVDGEATPDVDRQWLHKTDWKPLLTDVRFGWESYGDQANTVWVDDIAIGHARLGCGSMP